MNSNKQMQRATLAGSFLLSVAACAVWCLNAGYTSVLETHAASTRTIEPVAAFDEELDGQPFGNPDMFGYGSTTVVTGYLERALDLDHDLVKNRIPDLQPEMYTGSTNIAGGMRVGIEEFANNPRGDGTEPDKIMILMTDGHANVAEAPETSPKASIDYYAAAALSASIVIHGVTLGSEADAQSIQEAATLTGGIYRHVPDDDLEGLLEAFKEIGLDGGHAKLVR